ncbi:unnamed protein product [Peniophora sp. CBMAI 1063]|nr:unnamed protein product [Peniophora sp. CBMAI 1063]
MHRFRKWSDPRKSAVPENARNIPRDRSQQAPEVPALPPPSDFRTSLILPDLSRRFSLLRTSTGDFVPLDDLRSKFAEQRARGSENAISQEEEDMLLATLGRLRQKTSITSSSSLGGGESGYNSSQSNSVRSSDITVSSSAGSFTSRANRRRSNNLFGSGRFADEAYLRHAQKERKGSTQSSVLSGAGSRSGSDATSSTYKNTDSAVEGTAVEGAALERTLSKMLPRNQLHRASMALDEVIREIEEEAEDGEDEGDDKVLVPRSPIDARTAASVTATAYTSEDRSTPSPYPRSSDASPTPRLPGYIPGMPRPMTPRDWEDGAYDSATPRATSPQNNGPLGSLRRDATARAASPLMLSAFMPIPANGHRDSDNELGYSNGRQTPDATVRARGHARHDSALSSSSGPGAEPDDSFMDFGTPPDASILGDRMRPKSPFAGGSRPSTPSNITWRTPASPASSSFVPGHSRNGSAASDVSSNAAAVYGRRRSGSVQGYNNFTYSEPVERATSPLGARSLRSPPLPDSPTGGAAFAPFAAPDPRRPPSVNSGLELGSPAALVHRQLRSPTPTNANAVINVAPLRPRSPASPIRPRSPASPVGRSPASPVYSDFGVDRSANNSRASSRAGQYALRNGGGFSLNQGPHALLLSPTFGNSSRESLESTGSSYHSRSGSGDKAKDGFGSGIGEGLLSAMEPLRPQWHELEVTPSTSTSTSSGLGLGLGISIGNVGNGDVGTMSAEQAEEHIRRLAGLTRGDFVKMQERLVGHANANEVHRERRDSLKRRRRSLSASQSSAPKFAEAAPEPMRVMSPIDPRANALLESLVDDRKPVRPSEPPTISVTLPVTQQRSISPSPSLASSPSLKRRRAALADALFGGTEFDDSRDVVSPLQPSPSILPLSLEGQRSASRSPDIERREPRSPDFQPAVISPSDPAPDSHTLLSSQAEEVNAERSPVFARYERPSSPATPQRSERTLRSPITAQHDREVLSSPTKQSPPFAHQQYDPVSPSASSPALPLGNPTELALEVQRRTDVAMAMINKSPSSPHLPEQPHITPKKRIDVNSISRPQLKWASTSVETIPIPQNAVTSPSPVPASASTSASMSAATGSKLGGRFKKLRGTLRAKPVVPTGEEVSPFTLMTPGPTSASASASLASPSAQSIMYNPGQLAPSAPSVPQSARAADFDDRLQGYSVTTPPASAGPGLKGFMSRFRKKSLHESAESESLNARAAAQYGANTVGRVGGAPTHLAPGRPTQVQMNISQEVHSAPAHKPAFSSDSTSASSSAPRRSSSMRVTGRGSSEASLSRSATMRAAMMTSPHGRVTPSPVAEDDYSPREQEQEQPGNDQAALRQLFDAASNLGLDQDALSDLLSRSTSLSTKRTTGASKAPKHVSGQSWVDPSRATSPFAASARAMSPVSDSGRQSLDQTVRMPLQQTAKPEASPAQNPVVRKQAARKSATPTEASRRSTVVRRTIIMPSDLQSLKELRQSTFGGSGSPQPPLPTRKGSTRSRRRSAGAASVLSPSVHDRVPTPPPPKSPTGMRFSTDSSPPLPQMPFSVPQRADSSGFLAPPQPIEKSNSTYDSLYDMYTSDSKPTILTVDTDPDTSGGSLGLDALNNLEPGSAVEVLEMANGETVWSIVNGLRDPDALDAEEAFYGNRASFMSEYSMRDDEGVQVYFKEHARKGSKDSASSFLSRHKAQQEPSKRPETKVFYSSTAQIGRLIENLSSGLGVDSGSFNIVPGPGAPRSYHSESSANWTVEERIERMLASNSNY